MKKEDCCVDKKINKIHHHGNAGGGAVYGIGLIGALVYFLQHATSFWEVVLGIGKAIIWPGMIIYRVLELLKL